MSHAQANKNKLCFVWSGKMNRELAVNVAVELDTLSNKINTQEKEEPAMDIGIESVNQCVEMIRNEFPVILNNTT